MSLIEQPCKIAELIKSIKGIASNSTSPTDYYSIKFKDNLSFNNKKVDEGFLKLFISNNLNLNKALKYEGSIYELLSFIIRTKCCPFFSLSYVIGKNCDYNNIMNIIKKSEIKDNYTLEKNFARNIYYLENKLKNRPALETENYETEISKDYIKKVKGYKYDFILSENIKGIKLRDYLEKNKENIRLDIFNNIYKILFQISIAMYTLSLCQISHNDLHLNNIFICGIPKRTIYYTINSKRYKFTTDFIIKIYDYDRAYSTLFGNNESLYGERCQNYNQCNEFTNGKDMLYILYRLFILFSKMELMKGNMIKSNIIKSICPSNKKLYNQLLTIHKYKKFENIEFDDIYNFDTIIHNFFKLSTYKFSSSDKNIYKYYLSTSKIQKIVSKDFYFKYIKPNKIEQWFTPNSIYNIKEFQAEYNLLECRKNKISCEKEKSKLNRIKKKKQLKYSYLVNLYNNSFDKNIRNKIANRIKKINKANNEDVIMDLLHLHASDPRYTRVR
jgi:hypothetical protein